MTRCTVSHSQDAASHCLSGSSLQEAQKIGIDGRGFSCRHTVRKSFVGLQRPVSQKLGGQRTRIRIGHDLIVLAVHHQHGHGDLLEVFGEIGLREGGDAVVVRLAPPIMPCRHQLAITASDFLAPGRLKP